MKHILAVVDKIVSVCLTLLLETGTKELRIVVLNKKKLKKKKNKINVQVKGNRSHSITGKEVILKSINKTITCM